MKLNKIAIVALAVASLSLTAFAQRGLDTFSIPRTLSLGVANIGPLSGLTTNGPYDIKSFDGVAKVDIFCYTNSGTTGGTITAQLWGSTDQTNFVALANYALVTGTTTITYTNYFYGGTNLIASNKYLLPGTVITPNAAVSGWATVYLNPLSFTNSGAITPTAGGLTEVGFNAGDALRYLYLVWTPGGTVTNFTTGAILTGNVHSSSYPF